MSRQRRFTTTVSVDPRGRTHVSIPFDPNGAWGPKPRHPVTGTVGGQPMRGVINTDETGPTVILGPAWNCSGLRDGDTVEVVLEPEGPQRADLTEDIAAALDAAPDAAAAFDGLAQFYRKQWLTWIDSTKRRPDQRPVRIAEMISRLQAGHKERQ